MAPVRWWSSRRDGYSRFDNDPLVATTTLFLDITTRVTSGGETGVFGLAFHPAFPADPRGLVPRLSEFTSRDGGLTQDANSERIILTIRKPEKQSQRRRIAFGPDGFLYAGIGDGYRGSAVTGVRIPVRPRITLMFGGFGNPQTPRGKKLWWIFFVLFLVFIVLTVTSEYWGPYVWPYFAHDFRW